MSYRITVYEEARKEMLEAYLYYEQQALGLGDQFLFEIESRFEDLERNPEYYSFIDQYKILRDIALRNFPYVIIYKINEKEVRVYSVFHTGKNPFY